MKTKILIFLSVIILGALSIHKINTLKEENKRLSNNQSVLMAENNYYKVRDSLNAISAYQLEFKIAELEKYRQEDLKLIKDLKISKSSLEKIIDIKTQSVNKYKALLRDSITRDTVINRIDTIKCFEYKSVWTDIKGCINKDIVDLQIKNRESLIAIENLEKKKFLFFKLPIWLFGYKSKKLDVISNNPNTIITNIEYIAVKK